MKIVSKIEQDKTLDEVRRLSIESSIKYLLCLLHRIHAKIEVITDLNAIGLISTELESLYQLLLDSEEEELEEDEE